MTRHIFTHSAALRVHAAQVRGVPVNMPEDDGYDPVLEQYERDHQAVWAHRRETDRRDHAAAS
jgi:hypothetical protein